MQVLATVELERFHCAGHRSDVVLQKWLPHFIYPIRPHNDIVVGHQYDFMPRQPDTACRAQLSPRRRSLK